MTVSIDNQLIDTISAALSRNDLVRRDLPDGSRLHIDRQLPFLCVYRRPLERQDTGTERLLLGEASYLLATSRERHFPELASLVDEIARRQGEQFGAFLLFELWSAAQCDEDFPLFHIHAPKKHPPQEALEELESKLLTIEVEGQTTRVELSYHEKIHPPELKPLLPDVKQDFVTIGLQVKPIYHDMESGELYPFELRELHHALARVLKHTFYTFTHSHTRYRPQHYYELGRHAMTKVVNEVDEKLANISQQFDLLLHVTPVNAPQAWEHFRKSKFVDEPDFLYRSRPIDPALLKRTLYNVPIENIEDPTLAHIYQEKQGELDRQITLVGDRNTSRFLYGSRQIYGDVEETLLQLAQEILQEIPAHLPNDHVSDYLDAEQFAGVARDEIEFYRNQNIGFSAKVEVRDDVTGILVSKGNLLVGYDARVPRSRVAATLAHEIGTHVLTYYNGFQQPLRELYTGMADYEPLQEGIAVLAEYLVGGLTRPRLRLLAGRVMAVHSIYQGADFVETFRTLHDKYEFSQSTSFNITMRVYRGGGYTKDMVYLRGLMNLLSYLSKGGSLELLMLGKVSYEQLPFIEELRWRKVLSPAALRPRYLDEPEVQKRLLRLGQGLSVLELVSGDA